MNADEVTGEAPAFPAPRAAARFSPGRIEVLGKHTDYAGGQSLLMAIEEGVTARATPAAEGWRASTTALPGEVDLLGDDPLPAGHWGRYVRTVARRLAANFGTLTPCRVEIDSTLPLASGMSSSSAVVVASALALADLNGFSERAEWTGQITSPELLAGYLACIENGSSFGTLAGDKGVGTFGGSEDHTAMTSCLPGRLSRFRFGPVARLSDVPVPEGLVFVVATSGVLAEKTGAAREAYNQASLRAGAVASAWREATGRDDPTIGRALAGASDAADRLRTIVAGDAVLARRLEHFLLESESLVPAAARALGAGDLAAFGEIVDASQAAASTLLGNQVPETEALAALARSRGAHAASSFGAGFGGSVWALVDSADADAFGRDWTAAYLARFPERAAGVRVCVTRPSGPVRRV